MNEPIHAKSNFWLQAIKVNNQNEKNYLLNFLYKNKIKQDQFGNLTIYSHT